MKAAIYKGIGKIDIEDIPLPKEEKGKLFRVLYVGICGTDVKTFKRGHPLFKPPCILGHEFVAQYNGRVFVVSPYIECGECSVCRKGVGELCQNKAWIDGALSEYVLVPDKIINEGIIEIPKHLDPKVFVLTEPLACVIHGIQRARIQKGDKVLVVGGGLMGLLFAISLDGMGCEVVLSEIDDYRRERIKNFGFNTINPKDSLDDKKVFFDSIVLANDRPELVSELLPFTIPGGTFLLFGGMPKDATIEISPYLVHYKEIDVVGSFGFAISHFRHAYTFIEKFHSLFSKLITCEFNFDKVKSAFLEAQKRESIKVVVKINP